MSKVSRRALMTGAAAVGVTAAGAVGYRVWRDREPTAPAAQDAQGHLLWRNWSGIRDCYPAQRGAPANEAELAGLIKTGPAPIRAVGAGHSFTALVPTSGLLLTLDQMSGVISHDADKLQATVRAGTRLGDLGPALAAIGQEMPNLPDINKQSLAGAMSTGTHGTGHGLKAVHGEALSFRLATAKGEVIDCSPTSNPDIYNAARVGLGAFGVLTEVTLQNQPLKRIVKRVELRDFDEICEDWPKVRLQHRNAEFYAIPFTGKAALITADVTDQPVVPRGPDVDTQTLMDLKKLRDLFGFVPPLRKAVAQSLMGGIKPEVMVDEGWKLLSNDRPVRFNEMEFHLPREAQIPALKEVVAAIEKHRSDVFFPIEVRTIEPDDAWLSPFYNRPSGSVAVHAYYKDDYQFLFDLIEPIFRRHEGRPHWGKLNSLKYADFATLYPRWKDACAVRAELDPTGRFLNPYLRSVFLGQA
ncbi:D-arabinono-1,4-lactone oxidase [Phenylobacterium montanum]|uniref:FAD-binding protein n=1 Tax=Phenylobacterium montanum TaxID=2823693 RepID=A0A975G261_9CAUL|nr:D-arabinono-1,4-lactone oxidase [Caulobacter sp. S6]QUD89758.1 FAD-binding protein [Caulobacter sp. S6]